MSVEKQGVVSSMSASGSGAFWANLKALPRTLTGSVVRHGAPTSDRARSQSVFGNVFLHIHATRVHPHSLRLTTSWGLGVSLISQFAILADTGILLMVYYKPGVELAYASIKDIHYVVPAGRVVRNVHRWAAHLMVFCVILHMARVFYSGAYKAPREFNWLLGMGLFVLTLGLSFSGYLLPWDQLAYWAVTIGANIAASPNELIHALGLPEACNVGDVQKRMMLGANQVGQEALTRFYLLHVMVLPVAMAALMAAHVWRIRKDGGLARPSGTPSAAGKGVGSMAAPAQAPAAAPSKTYGLMCLVKGRSPHTGQDPDETVPSWPLLLRAELLVLMLNLLVCLALGLFLDAPLKEMANGAVPENPAKAPWYFLGLQEMVSYSAFVGGIVVPTLAVLGLALIPYLDREPEAAGVWFSGQRGKVSVGWSAVVGAILAGLAVGIPVRYGWLRSWFPDIPQLLIIAVNPGSLLTLAYVIWSLLVISRTKSTRAGALALFSCFLVGFVILTYVGTFLRGPNWGFYWSPADWPVH